MNTKKLFLLTLAVLLQSSILMAETIRGKVLDASTGEEMVGVTVLLKGSNAVHLPLLKDIL